MDRVGIIEDAWREAVIRCECGDAADVYDEMCEIILDWAAEDLLTEEQYRNLLAEVCLRKVKYRDYNWRYDSYFVPSHWRKCLGG